MGHVHRIHGREPHVTVNTGAFIEPPLKTVGIHAHDQDIRPAGIGVRGDVIIEAGVSADVSPQNVAVQPDQRVAIGPIEIQPERLPGIT